MEAQEEILTSIPITELRIGTAAFRRALAKLGFKTLQEVLDADEFEIEHRLSNSEVEAYYQIKDQYEKNPKQLLSKLEKPKTNLRGTISRSENTHNAATTTPRVHKTIRQRSAHGSRPNYDAISLPKDEVGRALKEFEMRAKESFDRLDDRDNEYLAFEAFEDFALELDDIRCYMILLFAKYKGNPTQLAPIIEHSIPNLFILYFADRSRTLFDGKNLWGHLFNEVGVSDQNHQARFKTLFINCLERRGMPAYAKDEQDFYYLYTALLHGGLSEGAWEEIWGKALLRLARHAIRDPYGFGQQLGGSYALSVLSNPEGKYALNKSVWSILQKVPAATTIPIIESAINVAKEMVSSSGESVAMLNSQGLPPAALEALRGVQRENNRDIARSQANGNVQRHEIVILQRAELFLDLAQKNVYMVWKAQRLPKEYEGCQVDFYIDGRLEYSKEVESGIGTAVLTQMELQVGLRASYSVLIKLMRPVHTSRGNRLVEVGSLRQSFERVHAGCFEFMKNPDGTFRLRNKKDIIRRERVIAYIVKDGREIVPGVGMKLSEVHEMYDGSSRKINLYVVEPGASGSVVRESDRAILSAWHESYRATVRRDGVIGRTEGGIDVFGVIQSEYNRNVALPEIVIHSVDGWATMSDLDVTCLCDGASYNVMMTHVHQVGEREGFGQDVAIRLGAVDAFPTFVNECRVEIRQRSSGVLVCRYRFAVVPISYFELTHISNIDFSASYVIRTVCDLEVTHGKNCDVVVAGSAYMINEPLSHEATTLMLRKVGEVDGVTVTLGLAGIDIHVPKELRQQSFIHPLNANDANEATQGFGMDDIVAVRTTAKRSNRFITLKYGDNVIVSAEESSAVEHKVSLFADPSVFAIKPEEKDNSFSLLLKVHFGMERYSAHQLDDKSGITVTLLRLERGLGIGAVKYIKTVDGKSFIRFEYPATADMHGEFFVDFSKRGIYRSGKTVHKAGECPIELGTIEMRIPNIVAKDIVAQRRVLLTISPLDIFGRPDKDFAMTLPIGKE